MKKQLRKIYESPSQIRARRIANAFRIIVAGTRTFNDYKLFCKKMDKLTCKLPNIYIVTGDAKGPDKMATRWAFENMWSYSIYRADWDKHGKAAGPIRNQSMVDNGKAKAAIVFWDGKSSGSRDLIQKARKKGLTVKVVRI